MARRGLVWIAVLVGFVSSLSAAQQASVTGTVAYRERIALPPTAIVEVTLEDVWRADAATDVISRLTMQAGGQVPMGFELPYEPGRIEEGHRYAVRARILDGARVLFASTDTVLVLTQGHGTRVSMLLRMVPGVSAASIAAMAPPAPAPAPRVALPPVIELRDLPATFTGTLPCADCQGLMYELSLFPDDSFHLRTTHLGKGAPGSADEVGSWGLSSDRRVVVVKADDRPAEYFSIRDNTRLRKLDMNAQEIVSTQAHELRRSSSFSVMDVKGAWKGAYRQGPDGRWFTECASGQRWTVAEQSGAAAALDTAYRQAGRKAGEALVVSIQGHLEAARGVRSVDEARVVVAQVNPVSAGDTCAPRFATAPLEGTNWELSWLAGSAATIPPTQRNAPSLTFRADSQTFSGAGGCNRLTGQYQARGDTLGLSAAGTMMACPNTDALEASFRSALSKTRAFRILGHTLELYDDQRQLLARFEASKP
jgi:copper homeostasis protein (lipoprotein)